MAKPSNKKVTRAARTSGGRTARGATPWGWYSVMGLVVLLGCLGVWQSREQRIDKATTSASAAPKKGDHWHAAIGVYECDHFSANIPDSGRDPHGIHTHGDGIMHIHPFDNSASGKNATIGVFADTVGMKLDATSFKVPGENKTWTDGKKCNDKPGEVQLFVNGTRRSGNPASYAPKDRDLLVIAFAPRKADVPKTPPSAPNLDKLSDVPSTPSTLPGQPPAAAGDQPATPAPAAGDQPATPPATDSPGTTAPPSSSTSTP
ncbi:MAG: hypothetical protein QOK43_1558 [Acidimicrobiaceae bacterium]|nr:hypothetical protein [Acidimicrobiaceae bacterium]